MKNRVKGKRTDGEEGKSREVDDDVTKACRD